MKKAVTTQKKIAVFHLLDSLLSGAIVLYATFMIRDFEESKAALSALFFLLAAENVIRLAEGRRTRMQRLCVMAFYLIGAVLILVLEPFHSGLLAAAVVEFAVLLFNRITAILKNPRIRVIALNVLSILIILVLAAFVFGGDMWMNGAADADAAAPAALQEAAAIAESFDQLGPADAAYSLTAQDLFLSLCLMLVILFRMILHVVGISVSQIKLNILMNIVRETYVMETLLGLLLMIIASSSLLSTMEESMPTYGDALWYCFALVTTIGFGDITAATPLGRILSVLLGIYGIVVVAIITSVIVNFYGEMRRITWQNTDVENAPPDGDDCEEVRKPEA